MIIQVLPYRNHRHGLKMNLKNRKFLKCLCDFIEEHPTLVSTSEVYNVREKKNELWEEATDYLNHELGLGMSVTQARKRWQNFLDRARKFFLVKDDGFGTKKDKSLNEYQMIKDAIRNAQAKLKQSKETKADGGSETESLLSSTGRSQSKDVEDEEISWMLTRKRGLHKPKTVVDHPIKYEPPESSDEAGTETDEANPPPPKKVKLQTEKMPTIINLGAEDYENEIKSILSTFKYSTTKDLEEVLGPDPTDTTVEETLKTNYYDSTRKQDGSFPNRDEDPLDFEWLPETETPSKKLKKSNSKKAYKVSFSQDLEMSKKTSTQRKPPQKTAPEYDDDELSLLTPVVKLKELEGIPEGSEQAATDEEDETPSNRNNDEANNSSETETRKTLKKGPLELSADWRNMIDASVAISTTDEDSLSEPENTRTMQVRERRARKRLRTAPFSRKTKVMKTMEKNEEEIHRLEVDLLQTRKESEDFRKRLKKMRMANELLRRQEIAKKHAFEMKTIASENERKEVRHRLKEETETLRQKELYLKIQFLEKQCKRLDK